MAIELVSVKCPDCGATLNIESDRKQAFCTYCDAKVVIDNGRDYEFTYHKVDDAEVKRAETEHAVLMKKLEMEEKRREDAKVIRKKKATTSIILAVVGAIFFIIGATVKSNTGPMLMIFGMLPLVAIGYVWLSNNNAKEEIDLGDKAKVPSGISDYEKQSFITINSMLIGAGFTNVKCVPLNDLNLGVLKKPNTVESITINGSKVTHGGGKFPKDAIVIVSYHSMNR